MAHLRTASCTDEISKVGANAYPSTRTKGHSQKSDCSEHTGSDFMQQLLASASKARKDATFGSYLYHCLETVTPWLPSVRDSEYYLIYPKNAPIGTNIIGIIIMLIRSSSNNLLQDVNMLRSFSYEIVTQLELCNKPKRATVLSPRETVSGYEHQSEIKIGFSDGPKQSTDKLGPFSCLDSDISAFCSLLSTTTTRYKKLSSITIEAAVVNAIKNLGIACSAAYDDETKTTVQSDLLRSFLFNLPTQRFPHGRHGMVAYTLVKDSGFTIYGRYTCQLYLRRILLLSATLLCTPTFEFCDSKQFSSHRTSKVTALYPDVVVKLSSPFVFSSNAPFPWSLGSGETADSTRAPDAAILPPEVLSTYFNIQTSHEYGSNGYMGGAMSLTHADSYTNRVTYNIGQEIDGLEPPERIVKNTDYSKASNKFASFIPGTRILDDQSGEYNGIGSPGKNDPQMLLAPVTNCAPDGTAGGTKPSFIKCTLTGSAPLLTMEQVVQKPQDVADGHTKCDLADDFDFNKMQIQTKNKLYCSSNTNTYTHNNMNGNQGTHIRFVDDDDASELSRSESPIVQTKRPVTAFARPKPKFMFGKSFKKKDEIKEETLPPFLSVAATKDGLKHEPKLVAPTTTNGNESYKRITANMHSTGSPVNYIQTLESFSTRQGAAKSFSNRGPDGEDKFYHLRFKCGDGSILMYVQFTKESGGATEGYVILGQSHFQWDVTVVAGPQVLDLLVGGRYVDSIYLSMVGDYTICFKILDKGAWIDLAHNYDVFSRVL